MVPLTVVILTYNEALHIHRAVANVLGWAQDVFVVDSLSSDGTQALAGDAGAAVFEHPFTDYASQREWALRNLPYQTEWMLFLDADELVSEELKRELAGLLPALPGDVDGLLLKRKLFWMNHWIRHGGVYPTWILRVVRHERASMDGRQINEHLRVPGAVRECSNDLLHIELHSIASWVDKHNRYATMEAVELQRSLRSPADSYARFWGAQPQRKRWLMLKVWQRIIPSALRPFVLFAYQYLFRCGFLDGGPGLSYFALKSLYYRMLIESNFRALRKYDSMRCNTEDAIGSNSGASS